MVFRWAILKNSNAKEVDEPVDFMVYMIVAGLGFAAFENILILLGLGPQAPLSDIVSLSILRLVGATFLHALASGTLGYFLAMAVLRTRWSKLYFAAGLLLVTLLHGFFNIYIIKGEGISQIVFPLIILIGLALFTRFGFKQLKSLKGKVLQ